MTDESANTGGPAASATSAPRLPTAVERATFQAELDKLRAREKAHTRAGDAIAAARRRLPMVEVDASLALTGPRGQTMDNSYALMDLTVYGRQERWEDSPPGWPKQCSHTRTNAGPPDWPPVPKWPGGRPIAQWPRLAAWRSDDLAAGHDGGR